MISTFCSEFDFKPQVFHSNSERSSSFDRVLSEVDFDPDMKGIIYLFYWLNFFKCKAWRNWKQREEESSTQSFILSMTLCDLFHDRSLSKKAALYYNVIKLLKETIRFAYEKVKIKIFAEVSGICAFYYNNWKIRLTEKIHTDKHLHSQDLGGAALHNKHQHNTNWA